MPTLTSTNPATGETIWQGKVDDVTSVNRAIIDAQRDARVWSAMSLNERINRLRDFARIVEGQREQLAQLIMCETGKPLWEARSEAGLIAAKVDATINAYEKRHANRQIDLPQGTGRVRFTNFRGIVAVIGPFNLPAHLPNGHIVPALLAGNAIVFKPSEYTPAVGEKLVEMYREAGILAVHLVQGDRKTGEALVDHNAIAAVLFTGSYHGGCAIHRALAGRPEVLLALEMGGNNPLVVHRVKNLDAAAYTIIISAFITSGQRCTCARRLIVTHDETDALVDRLTATMSCVRVGLPDEDPSPFMGTLIHAEAADRMLESQAKLIEQGGQSIVSMQRSSASTAMLTPGLMDVTNLAEAHDEEYFGPMLQLIRVRDFDEAIEVANRSRFGLAAALLSDDASLWPVFRERIRAGVVNYNTATTGASGKLPFGGLGASGNHRPSGYHAIDYCGDDIASIEVDTLQMPKTLLPGLDA